MTRILVVAAALGLGLSGASACDFQRSAELDQHRRGKRHVKPDAVDAGDRANPDARARDRSGRRGRIALSRSSQDPDSPVATASGRLCFPCR